MAAGNTGGLARVGDGLVSDTAPMHIAVVYTVSISIDHVDTFDRGLLHDESSRIDG
jgi:hypothetical protein